MKFQVTFKTPDVLDNVDMWDDEDENHKARELASKYIRYGEYVTVEFDTDAGTARVVPVGG